MRPCEAQAAAVSRHVRRWPLWLLGVLALLGCSDDGPAGTHPDFAPVEVDVYAEATAHNGGDVYEFVVDEDGYVSAPAALPAGEVMVTLTYEGADPAPHSLVFEGLNDEQPVVAVDLPGSNNGSIVLPEGHRVFFDGAPGNRARGYQGDIDVTGSGASPAAAAPAASTLRWHTEGLEFTSMPPLVSPAGVPVVLELSVDDALPHSIAFEQVRGGQPLVAVDGPGTNRRTITMPRGTYVYFCAVPGHREAGMEGLVTFR